MELDLGESLEYKELHEAICPHCGAGPLDGVTGIGEKGDGEMRPHDGSPTICSYCGELLIFHGGEDGNMRVEIPSAEEIADWESNKNFWYHLKRIQQHLKDLALQGRLSGDMKYGKSKPHRRF